MKTQNKWAVKMLGLWLGLCLAIGSFVPACSAGVSTKPGCTDPDLAALEMAYVAEVLSACHEFDDPDECPAYPDIQARFDQKRKEWVACQ